MIEKHNIDAVIYKKLYTLIEAGLIENTDETYALTKLGWYNYSDIMYFFMPKDQQALFDNNVAINLSSSMHKDILEKEVFYTTQ